MLSLTYTNGIHFTSWFCFKNWFILLILKICDLITPNGFHNKIYSDDLPEGWKKEMNFLAYQSVFPTYKKALIFLILHQYLKPSISSFHFTWDEYQS